MEQKTINGAVRTETGKNANHRLRAKGFIPAVIYSHGKSEPIQINQNDFFKLFKGAISESIIFNINIQGSKEGAVQSAYIKDYQTDPITGKILHLDLFKVTSGEKIHTAVPVEIVGTAKGVKAGGVIEIGERHVEIECLPASLPEKITIDVSDLEIGGSVHAKDLKVASGIKILSNPEAVFVSVHVPRKTEEAAPAETPAPAENA